MAETIFDCGEAGRMGLELLAKKWVKRWTSAVKGKLMAENLMCHEHKGTSEKYRREYDRIFRKEETEKRPASEQKVKNARRN